MTTGSHEVTHLMALLSEGDEDAFGKIWKRYYPALVAYVRRRMTDSDRRQADEEDYALSAMKSFWRGFQSGRFDGLTSRDDLWRLMITIASRKVTARRRRNMADKRGKGGVRGSSALAGGSDGQSAVDFQGGAREYSTPDAEAEMLEDFSRLLSLLPDESLRQVALLRLEGYSNSEIADHMDCAARTVTRKLGLIRRLWSHEMGDAANV